MSFDDLWTEATRDYAREAADADRAMARLAASRVWPFIANATSEGDLDMRLVMIADPIIREASAVGVGQGEVVEVLRSDWHLLASAGDAAGQDQDDSDDDSDDDSKSKGKDKDKDDDSDDDDDDSDDDDDDDDDGVPDDKDSDGGKTFDPDNDGDDDSDPSTDTDHDGGSGKPWEKSSARHTAGAPLNVYPTGSKVFYPHFMGDQELNGQKGFDATVVAPPGTHGYDDRKEEHVLRKADGSGNDFFAHLGWGTPKSSARQGAGFPDSVAHTAIGGQFDREYGEETDDHCPECGIEGGYGQPGGECPDCNGRNDKMGICPTCTPRSERGPWENEHLDGIRSEGSSGSMATSDSRPGTCDSCGSTNVSIIGDPPVRGTGPGGRGRMGDSGYGQKTECKDCGHTTRYSADWKRASKTAGDMDPGGAGSIYCGTCKGSGAHPWDSHRKCPKCKGTGVKKAPRKQVADAMGVPENEVTSMLLATNPLAYTAATRTAEKADDDSHHWTPWQYKDSGDDEVQDTPNGTMGKPDVVTYDEGMTDPKLSNPQTYQQQISRASSTSRNEIGQEICDDCGSLVTGGPGNCLNCNGVNSGATHDEEYDRGWHEGSLTRRDMVALARMTTAAPFGGAVPTDEAQPGASAPYGGGMAGGGINPSQSTTKPRQMPSGGGGGGLPGMNDGSSDFDPASMGADQKDEQAPAAGAADTKVIARILRADPTLSLPEAREMAKRVALIDPTQFGSTVPQHDGPLTEFLKHTPERLVENMNKMPSGPGKSPIAEPAATPGSPGGLGGEAPGSPPRGPGGLGGEAPVGAPSGGAPVADMAAVVKAIPPVV